MALHEQSVGKSDEWYTPPRVFEALACRFDMDVASPGREVTPWIPANDFITKDRDGLSSEWRGFVWMNAPFGGRNGLVPWLEKFFQHRNGIALVPDRTSAPWWQKFAPCAWSICFVAPKIKFINAAGIHGSQPAQGTCLFAIGSGCTALWNACSAGLGLVCVPQKLRLERPLNVTALDRTTTPQVGTDAPRTPADEA